MLTKYSPSTSSAWKHLSFQYQFLFIVDFRKFKNWWRSTKKVIKFASVSVVRAYKLTLILLDADYSLSIALINLDEFIFTI